MHVKRFNALSGYKKDNAGCDRELSGIASAVIHVSIQTLIIVWYTDFKRKQTVSQKLRGILGKAFIRTLKTI